MDNQGQQELIVLDTFEPAVAFDPAKRDESRRRFSMFLVQSEAGQGGTGVVQRATNTAGEIFAIKRLHVSDTTDERIAAGMRAVLFEEYRNQLTVSHLKGFPRVYGYGTSNGEPLIVMEWVEGSTLKHITPQLPHEDGGVRGDAVAAIGVAVLSILNNVRHLDTGVAHRDISPRNIMVATSERSLQDQLATLDFDIRLIDFGSSTALNPIDPTFTVRADVWRGGTPEYAPPEMLTHDIAGIETRRLSPTVDIYALSSVLYELYCGHTPFNLQALGTASPYRVKTETAFEVPQARTAADEALISIIVAGLAVDQERRPSVEQMLDLLRRWQSSELGDWPTPEPVWGSGAMDAQTTYIGPGTSVDEPVPATFDTAQPVMFPLDDDAAALVDPFVAASDTAAEGAPLDNGHQDRAPYLPVPVVLEAPRAAYGADAAVSTAASMPPAADTAAPVAQNAIFGGAAAGPSVSSVSAGFSSAASAAPTAGAATKAAASVSRRAFLAAGGLALTALAGGGAFLLTHSSNSGSDTAVAADTKSENNSSKSKKDSDSDSSDDTSPSSTISVEMRYAAQSDGKWGLIDDTGAWKVKPTYSDMRLYGAGLAAALDSATGMWGYIDQDGNWAIEPQFSDTRPFNDYGAVAQDAQTSFWGVLNRQGKWIVDAKYYAMGDMVLGNFVPYRSSNEEDSWGYIYIKTGKRNDVPPTFRGLGGWDSANGLGPATQDGTTWGYINGYGQWKIEPQFKAARRFASNRAAVQFDDGSWGYILPDGTRAFSAAFAEAREFANGWAPVKDQATGLWGCSTVSGAWQVEPKFRAMGDIFYTSSDVFLPVQDNESGKWGVLDDAGDWRVMPKFDAII
ncbi:MAG: WG repeat-containing protein [Collinsella sp.]